MSIKREPLEQILGKTIVGVVVSENASSGPQTRLHLIFSDKTSYEFWINDGRLSAGGGLDQASLEDVLDQLRNVPKTCIRASAIEPSCGIVQRDLLVDDHC